MTGRLLLKGNPPPPVHFCDPPGERSTIRLRWGGHLPLRQYEGRNFEGALWECDCGQAWHCRYSAWCAVSPRKARKILKRAARL